MLLHLETVTTRPAVEPVWVWVRRRLVIYAKPTPNEHVELSFTEAETTELYTFLHNRKGVGI